MKKIAIFICLIYLAGCGKGGGRQGAPIIDLSAAALAFTSVSCGSNPSSQTFEITNAGKRTLTWSVSNLPAWLVLTPDGGTAPSTVTAQVNAADLACGQTYSQTIEIVAQGASNTPVSFTVTLTIPAAVPAIGIDPITQKVTFTASTCGGVATSADPSFKVLNTGSGSFNWGATAAASWIQFAPLSGSAGTSVTVQDIDTSNLPCGQTSSGVITIASDGVENSPVSVAVEVVVPSAASITPSTTALGFFATGCKKSPDPLEFTIQNTGQTPLGWSAALTYTDGTGWASVDITGGSVAAGATSGAITVTVDPSGLTCGQGYAATLTLTGTSGGNNVTLIRSKTILIGLSNPIAWKHQNPKSTSYPINDVTFSKEGVAWAVGNDGTLLRSPQDSPDYGNNWIPVVSGTAENLHGIHFINSAEGWIVGDGGTILHSDNAGATWVLEVGDPDPITENLQSVYFLDVSNGWAVGDGGTIAYRGSDGKWIRKASGVSDQFTHIFMNDAAHGWITAKHPNKPLFWTDSNWTGSQDGSIPPLIPQTSPTVGELYSIFFLPKDPNSPFPNRLEGWAVGVNGLILHIYSDTGLETWTTEAVASGTPSTLLDLFMSTPSLGWAIGGDDNTNVGVILRWNGATWSPVTFNAGDPTLPSPQYMRGVSSNNGNGVAVGSLGMVFTTQNGTDWGKVSGPSVSNLKSVGFALDGVNGWAVGEAGTVLSTSNGGTSWVKNSLTGNFTGLSVVTATDVWAVNDTTRQIYHYSSGSWGLNTTLSGSGGLKGVHFVNATNGWAVGGIDVGGGVNRHVYYYNGTSWSAQTNFCDASVGAGTMNGVYFLDASRGWMVGTSGWTARTTDGGANWACTQATPTSTTWNAVHFVTASTGWAVGNSGRIYRTTDGGATWSPQTSTTTSALFAVRFSDANNGWVVGAAGMVLYTQNGGSTWTRQSQVGTNQNLNGLYFAPGGLEGWTVGASATLLHTVSGGVN